MSSTPNTAGPGMDTAATGEDEDGEDEEAALAAAAKGAEVGETELESCGDCWLLSGDDFMAFNSWTLHLHFSPCV